MPRAGVPLGQPESISADDRRSQVRLGLNIALLVFGAWLGLALLGWWIPRSEPPLLAERLANFEADQDAYDLLFFGSSRVFRGVDPSAFDIVLADRGHPLRSYNLGFPAMRPHEANAFLRRVLARRPARLRYVIIELADWEPELADALPDERFVNSGRFTERAIAWHDLSETRSVLRSVWRSEAPPREKIGLVGTHLAHWAARVFRVGESAMTVRRRLSTPATSMASTDDSMRGYTAFVPEDYRSGFASYFRKQFEANIASYQEAVLGLAVANSAKTPLTAYNRYALAEQIATIRAAGAEPVYLLPSRGDPTPVLHRIADSGDVPALIGFADPEVDRDLFDVEHRFDAQHLNPRGAEIFSRRLAGRFADWLEAP